MKPSLVAGVAAAAVLLALVLMWRRQPPSPTAPSRAPRSGAPSAAGGTAAAGRDAGVATATTAGRDGGHASSRARVVLSASWGSGAGQLGRRVDPESVAQGPMSFVVAPGGVIVLDNVNRRIARFGTDGRALPPIALDGEAAQDLARGAHGQLALLDRLHDKRVTLLDDSGRVRAGLPLVGAGLTEAAAVTGLFIDRDGDLYAEREHGAWLRLADGAGRPDTTRAPAPGRPLRDGRFLAAALADRKAGSVRLQLMASDGRPAWSRTVELGAPILFVALADGDDAGNVYLGAHVGHEAATPPYRIDDESLSLVALSADGEVRAQLTLPAPPAREESFRDLYLGDDGTIYWMRRTAAGVVVEAYRL